MTKDSGAATRTTPAPYPFWNSAAEILEPDVGHQISLGKAHRCVKMVAKDAYLDHVDPRGVGGRSTSRALLCGSSVR
jgi:hypothetical protein